MRPRTTVFARVRLPRYALAVQCGQTNTNEPMSTNDNPNGAREVPENHSPNIDAPDDRPECVAVERGGYLRVSQVGKEDERWLAIDTESAAERRR